MAEGLKILRIRLGLSQAEMANVLGIKQSGVSKIERGLQNITFNQLKILKKKYSYDVLFPETNPNASMQVANDAAPYGSVDGKLDAIFASLNDLRKRIAILESKINQ